jgi:glycosyltransferase involved in cell wall biosynthesis
MVAATMRSHDIAVIVTSFERPRSLARSLLSLSVQSARKQLSEVVVADDGSRDTTWQVVDRFARESGLTVTFTSHPHAGFQPGRSRNEGVYVSTAPYLAFIDGDCVVPSDFLAIHAARRRPGCVLCGESYRLTAAESETVTESIIRHGHLLPLVGSVQCHRMARKARRDHLYSLLRVPMRPRLTGNQFSLWRSDFERVDGFDLGFLGWGLEDRDLQRRLLRAGTKFQTVLPQAATFHLWHPVVSTFVRNSRGTPNDAYYQEPIRKDSRAHRGLSSLNETTFSVWRWHGGRLVTAPALDVTLLKFAGASRPAKAA